MKFTSTELFELLKAKISNNGKKNLAVSDRTLNGYVNRLYKRLGKREDAEELELDDVVSEYLDDVQEMDNNIRNDNSKFVKTWQEDHPEPKDPKKTEPTDKLDLLLQEIEGLKKEREADRAAKAIQEKVASLRSALKAKSVDNEEWINEQLKLVPVNLGTDVDALTESLVGIYNKFNAKTPEDLGPQKAGGKEEKTDFSDVVTILNKNRHID